MEQNKLEKEFRNKLNQRKINPSENSWDRLDAMLTTKEEKTKTRYGWIYIAASILGFAFLGTFFFSEKESSVENQKSTIVMQESVPTKRHKESSSVLNPNPASSENEVTVYVGKVAAKDNKKIVLKKDSFTNKANLNQNPLVEFSIINQKNEPESNATPAKALTVDELLARVNQSERLNKSNPNLEVRVNPNGLLRQMDDDLEPTFRQNVFSKVADNFKAVKEAVVNRNKE